MSNWSSVIVCWSGIDREAKSDWRPAAVMEAIRSQTLRSGVHHSPSCGDGSIGSACEEVVLAHVNSFDPDRLCEALRAMKWEFPHEVEFFLKNEDMDNYEVVRVFAEVNQR